MPMTPVTGARLQQLRTTLVTLASRRLPVGSDGRVAVRLVALRDAGEAYDAALAKLQTAEREAQRLKPGPERDAALDDVTARFDALNAQVFEVRLPASKLTAADLPMTWKSPDGAGEANQKGTALLAAQLAPDLFDLGDEEQ